MDFHTFLLNFLYSLLATVIGAILVAFILFWAKERFFSIPKVNGRWNFEMITLTSSYIPYRGMVLRYVAILWQEGSHVEGTVEKIYENSSTGEREYIGKNRTRGIASGFIEKNIFSKDRLFLHVVEDGHGRESTNFYELIIKSDGKYYGKFNSMVANQDGDVRWQRDEF